MTSRSEVLATAERLVNGDRDQAHGQPAFTFAVIASYWQEWLEQRGYLNNDALLRAEDVAAMMVLFKVARLGANPQHADSWIDVAGYAACGAEVAGA